MQPVTTSLGSVLTTLIPLALVISISPLSIIPAVLVLQTPRPRPTGLAFLGSWLLGLCTLTAGCYSYWNDMGDALRFFSLLIVLVTVIVIGLLKFDRASTQRAD